MACTCGIYATKPHDQRPWTGLGLYGICGEVYLWGTVVVAERALLAREEEIDEQADKLESSLRENAELRSKLEANENRDRLVVAVAGLISAVFIWIFRLSFATAIAAKIFIFRREIAELRSRNANLSVTVTVSRPGDEPWSGAVGRIDAGFLASGAGS